MYESKDDMSFMAWLSDIFDTGWDGDIDYADLDRAQILKYSSMTGDDLGVWIKNSVAVLCNQAMNRYGPWEWHHPYTSGDFDFEFNIIGLPETILINKEGMII